MPSSSGNMPAADARALVGRPVRGDPLVHDGACAPRESPSSSARARAAVSVLSRRSAWNRRNASGGTSRAMPRSFLTSKWMRPRAVAISHSRAVGDGCASARWCGVVQEGLGDLCAPRFLGVHTGRDGGGALREVCGLELVVASGLLEQRLEARRRVVDGRRVDARDDARSWPHLVSWPQPESRGAGAVDVHEVQPGDGDVDARAAGSPAVAAGQERRLAAGLRQVELGPARAARSLAPATTSRTRGRWRRIGG